MEDLTKQGEPALLIFTEAEDVGKLRLEVEERNRQLQTLVNGLTKENLELKSRMARLELETTEKTSRLKKIEAEVLKLKEAELHVALDLIQG